MSQNEPNIEAKKALESQISQIMLSSYYSGRSEGIDIGAMSERERIIKLIQDQCKCTSPDEYHPSLCTCQEFIAIIKDLKK